jgi:predicted ATPase
VVGRGVLGQSGLSLEVARLLIARYDDVRFVDLAPLADPSLVAQELARVLGVRAEPGRSMLEALVAAIGARRLLVVLDNCEHVLDAAAQLVDALVRAVPGVAVLATSREPLRISGERVWWLRSLPVQPSGDVSPEAALSYDATRLFVDRAIDTDDRFTLTAANARAVADICRRLDGIPLAIELAAARVSALTPSQIAARLDDRFRLLGRGSRAVPSRHQTLAAAVQWSYDLCSPAEQALLRRLSVFAGGFTLEAAETVCAGGDLRAKDVFDALSVLVDRSLAVALRDGDAARYSLLETIRAYAAERLVEAGEEPATRDAHLAWVVAFAESMAGALSLQQVTARGVLEPTEVEHDNVRKALEWATGSCPTAALAIVAAIAPFWMMRGYTHEGRLWADTVLAANAGRRSPDLRAAVLETAGGLAITEGDVARGRVLLAEAMTIFDQLGDARSVAGALGRLVHAAIDHERDYDTAERLARESLDRCEAHADDHAVSEALGRLATVLIERGDTSGAQHLIDRALVYNREHPDDPCPSVMNAAGRVAFLAADLDIARRFLEQQLGHARERGLRVALVSPLYWLGELALIEGDVGEAEHCFSEQLAIVRTARAWRGMRLGTLGMAKVALRRKEVASARLALDQVRTMAKSLGDAVDPAYLECAAELLAAEGRLERAARLLGAADVHRATIGAPEPAAYRANNEALRSQVTSGLGAERFSAAWAAGRRPTAAAALDSAFTDGWPATH